MCMYKWIQIFYLEQDSNNIKKNLNVKAAFENVFKILT